MAMSFSRPDPAAPAQVADATFSTGRRGFDQNEVRDFLRMVAAELARLHERERFLERELRSAYDAADVSTPRLDDETVTRMLGEEMARVLNAARESANEIREKAEQAAAQMLSEASDEAARRREEAETESSRRRADAANDAEAELAMAKQQGREMVNEARAYRERVLSELARRRELAREQIEQLIHGRDRLMQAFERARIVAVDVVAEMQPLGEPDEYVNLQPSTGPVPVMVARAEMPTAASTVAAEPEVAIEPEPEPDAEVEPEAEPEPEAEEAIAPDAEEAIEEAIEPEIEPETEVDDVVVDLFARIRATAAAVEADPEPEVEPAAELEPEMLDTEPDDTELDDAELDDAELDGVVVEATPFDQRNADLTPLIVASARRLKRVLADEQNEVLDALRRNDPVRNIDALLPWASHHAERYSSVLDAELHAAAEAGATLARGSATPKLGKAAAQQAVHHAADTLGRSLVMPLRDRLERCIADGDGDNPTITKKVRAVYREWKTRHIDEQLDDVLRTAHGRGMLAAIEVGSPVSWLPDPNHDVCPDCDDNRLAGDVAAGQAFPTGHVCTPAHPGCRCLLVPAGR